MFDLLRGVRILDLGTVVLGPYATRFLADLGADVIKVEPRGGDVFRTARPGHRGCDGAGFLNLNRNKRSIEIDMAKESDRALLDRLVTTADVFVHNMRPQSARRWRLDYMSVRKLRDDIVYCSARGFGEGAYGDEPAYDDCIQAASGLAWLNADSSGEPRFVRTVLCDKVAGLHLALAVASGLAARGRTGEGCQIETAMFEAMVAFLMIEQMSGQTFEPPLPDRGYPRLDAPGRKPYATRDGYCAIMPYTTRQWQAFLRVGGREDLANDPRVTDPRLRSNEIAWLYSLVETIAPGRTTAAWLALLREAEVPCSPVNRIEDLLDEPHLAATGFFRLIEHPTQGTIRACAPAITIPGAAEMPDSPPPSLNADRAAIIAELEVIEADRKNG